MVNEETENRLGQISQQELKAIHNYYAPKSKKVADAILENIISAIEGINFTHQYQQDLIQPEFRKIIVSHYKIIYLAQPDKISILNIFDTRQDPNKQHF